MSSKEIAYISPINSECRRIDLSVQTTMIDKAKNVLTILKDHNIPDALNNAQISKFFPSLTDTFIRRCDESFERHNGEKIRQYSHRQIAFMLLVRAENKPITPADRKRIYRRIEKID